MDSLNINSKILYTNAKNFGIDLISLYRSSAKLIVKKILDKYGNGKEYAIICGLAGNGGDGFAIALELIQNAKLVNVYLIGRSNHIEDPVAFQLWNSLKDLKADNLNIRQDCYAENIESSEIIVECLVGTGLVGEKLNKRFGDVVKRISHFKENTVAIDIPTPSYKPDLTISLIYPKTKEAEIVTIDLPKELTMYPGPGEEEVLFRAKKHSYKVKNGKLLYVFNSESLKNFERLVKYAQDYYTHIYVYTPSNFQLSMDKSLVTIIKDEDLDETIDFVDTIFLDEFNDPSLLNRAIISEITNYTYKKYILSNSAIDFLSSEKISALAEKLFIIDKSNLEKFSAGSKGEKGFKRISIELKTNLVVPSVQSYLYSDTGEFRLDITGKVFNKEFQQELLCLTAILSTKNDLWLSLRAADFMLVKV